MNVAEVIDQARADLSDAGKFYWSDQDLVNALNNGRDTLYLRRPRVYEVTAPMNLVAGHRQTVPENSEFLFNCIENISHVGQRAITVMDRELLDRVRPRWRSEAPQRWVAHYAIVPTEPKIFEVYPPVVANTQIRVSYAKPPVKLAVADYTAATDLTSEGELAIALVDYVVYEAYQKAADSSPDNGQTAIARLNAFMARVSDEATTKANTTPNTTSPGGRRPASNA